MRIVHLLRAIGASFSLMWIAAAPPAQAADRFWIDTNGGIFSIGGNWSGGIAPGAADNAHFNSNASYQVVWAFSVTNANAFFNARSGTVTQAIGTNFWLLTNTYIVGQSNLSTAAVTHVSGTLRVTNAAGTARFVVGQGSKGTYNLNGGTIVADQLFVTNNGPGFTNSTFNFNFGALTINNGSVITQAANFLIGTATNQTSTLNLRGGTNLVQTGSADTLLGNTNNAVARVLVTGSNTVWSNSGSLLIGNLSASNSLTISNGATVANSGDGVLGFNATASNNQVIVTGTNSLWTNSGLFIGNSGGGNLLLITNGGRVANTATRIGFNVSAHSNQIIVTGSNSVWTHSLDLRIGAASSFNTLLIAAGGRVENTLSRIGFAAGANSNQVIVTGPGSLWTNSADLRLGQSGSFNLLLISNGGWVANTLGSLGQNSDSSNNLVLVTGSGSVWSNADNLRLGQNGSFNTLLVTSNGTVFGSNHVLVGANTTASNNLLLLSTGALLTNGGDGVIGGDTNANFNTASLSDVNTRWLMGSNLYVGSNGAFNRLVLSNGALAGNDTATIGFSSSASNNEVLVTESGSFWSNRNDLFVANLGSGNRLLITNGGTVFAGTNAYVGFGVNSVNNLLVLSTGSLLTNGGDGAIGINTGANSNTASLSDVNTRWLMGGNLYVGSNGAFNRLVISNGATVFNTSGTIGDGSLASNNAVLVTGTNSVWSNSSQLFVGFRGSSNQLGISDGATVFNTSGVIGDVLGATSNAVLVTGTNSLWSNSTFLVVGYSASFNQLVVSNGAKVFNTTGHLGLLSGSDKNAVLVTGTNSVWSNSGGLTIGSSGSFNQLVISNGGVVANTFGVVGSSTNAGSNLALVTGASSLWSNSSSLTIGSSGSFNTLLISNGGTVLAAGLITGATTNSGSNRLTVAAGSLIVTNVGGTAALDIRRGTNVLNAGLIEADQLVMTNAAGVFEFNGGTFITRGAVISNGADFVVGTSGTTPAVWDVRAGASNHFLSGNLVVGSNSSFNQLLLTNGALLTNTGNGFIGLSSAARSNTALLDAGSRWLVGGNLSVGSGGAFNQLVISNGGVVANTSATLGSSALSSNNSVFATGTNSLWTNSLALTIGDSGSLNTLVVSNGGTVSSGNGVLGRFSTADGNQAVVTGPGSLWSNSGTLFVGSNGAFNTLLVAAAGTVSSTSGRIGFDSAGHSNAVTVAGSNSVWNMTGNLTVGRLGVGNRLIVSNGGLVRNVGAQIGDQPSASNNLVIVTGPGSVWTNSGILSVGSSGSTANEVIVTNGGALFSGGSSSIGPLTDRNRVTVTGLGSSWSNAGILFLGQDSAGNELLVSDGGVVTTGSAYVGRFTDGTNRAVVSGPGATWTTLGTLLVGADGASVGNQLIVSNGGTVVSVAGRVGDHTNSGNNQAIVTGTNSLWTSTGSLIIGEEGLSNSLIISSGGVVANTVGTVGDAATAGTNSVLVTGTGSVWSNSSELIIGNTSGVSGNQLVVSNGGTVFNTTGTLGSGALSSNNVAFVSGAGSLWSNSNSLTVGFSGAFNQLVISDGGVVANTGGTVGAAATAGTNSVLVTGAGSVWSNNSTLIIGNTSGASGNQLVVSNGGTVFNTTGTLGSGTLSSNNVALVTGTNSLWNNSSSLYVGYQGSGNQLMVSSGGVVGNEFGFIGDGSTSSNNEAVVTGAGSFWSNRFDLYVGRSGSGNRLVITNGGTVFASNAVYLGYDPSSSNNLLTVGGGSLIVTNPAGTGALDIRRGTLDLNGGSIVADQLFVTNNGAGFTNSVFNFNHGDLTTLNGSTIVNPDDFAIGATSNETAVWRILGGTNRLTMLLGGIPNLGAVTGATGVVIVDGSSTVWSNSSLLRIGSPGTGRLFITNGGQVFSSGAIVGVGGLGGNQARVSGPGSAWITTSGFFTFTLGNSSAGNELIIEQGGLVTNAGSVVFGSTSLVASNNSAIVTDPGSRWDIAGSLTISQLGDFNRLVVSNGGTVTTTNLAVGVGFGVANNRVVVDGGTLLATNAAGTGTVNVRRGTNVLNAGLIEADRLRLTDNAGIFEFNGGTLITRGGLISNGAPFIVGASGSTPAIWDVRAGASNMVVSSLLEIGEKTLGSQLLVTNGQTLKTQADENLVGQFIGPPYGSVFGFIAHASAVVGHGTTSGLDAAGAYAEVARPGSVWSNTHALAVGFMAPSNQLVIRAGGQVFSADGWVGLSSLSRSNQVVVTDAGSAWNIQSNLWLGFLSQGSRLIVSNGALLADYDASLGQDGDGSLNYFSSDNVAVVTGAGSLWSNRNQLVVGNVGSSNRLVITNGGAVFASNAVYLGFESTSSNNLLTVGGGNLIVTNSAGTGVYDIRRGTNVLNAGLIEVDQLVMTNADGFFDFNGGTLLTRGAVISNGTNFVVGTSGSTPAVWDVRAGASNHFLSGNLVVGSNSSFNQLLLTNGALLTNSGNGVLGLNSVARSNTASISGTNTRWLIGGRLEVGNNGSFNQLVISNGGVVISTGGRLGLNSGANSNLAVITGAGSLWSDSSGLFIIGNSGSFNRLVISNGGTVANTVGIIGNSSTGGNHSVLVTGAGSLWTNSSLTLGNNGSFNQLVISNGGVVVANGLFVGSTTNSGSNRLTVAAGNLIVTNAGGTAALDIRRGTNVLNAGLIEADRLRLTNSAGLFEFNGGTFNVRTAAVANSTLFTVGNGSSAATYRMSGAASNGHSFANGLVIASNATLTGNGTIFGSVTNFGTISAGSSAGSLTINGSLSLQSSSMMSFEIGGLIATNEYDVVNVTNFVQFAGTLSLSLLNNFLPAPTNSFTLVSFGSASGSFTNVTAGRVSLTNNLASFAVTQSATNLILGGVTYTDTDGDGQGDLQEAAAGTDPNNSSSYLAITSITQNVSNHIVLQFQSVSNKTYTVEYTDALGTPFTNIAGASFTAPAPDVGEVIDTGALTGGLGVTTRIYRVRLAP